MKASNSTASSILIAVVFLGSQLVLARPGHTDPSGLGAGSHLSQRGVVRCGSYKLGYEEGTLQLIPLRKEDFIPKDPMSVPRHHSHHQSCICQKIDTPYVHFFGCIESRDGYAIVDGSWHRRRVDGGFDRLEPGMAVKSEELGLGIEGGEFQLYNFGEGARSNLQFIATKPIPGGLCFGKRVSSFDQNDWLKKGPGLRK